MTNPRCFLELRVDGSPLGKLVIELRADYVPKTAEYFKNLCVNGKYKGNQFSRVYTNSFCQGGNLNNVSSIGLENFKLQHDSKGILSLLPSGSNQFNSEFIITLDACPQFDGKNVVLGKVVEGMNILDQIQLLGSANDGKPKKTITIYTCG